MFRLAMALEPYVERSHLGLVIPERGRDGITNRGVETAPLLVVEILSPTSGAIDREKKPARYGHFGIPEYWVLDPEERCAWVWRFAEGATSPERIRGHLGWRPAGAPEALTVELERLLAPL